MYRSIIYYLDTEELKNHMNHLNYAMRKLILNCSDKNKTNDVKLTKKGLDISGTNYKIRIDNQVP